MGLAPEESDVTMLEASALDEAAWAGSARVIEFDEAMRPALRSLRTGAELWPLGLALLAILVGTELLLVRVFAPRQVDADAMLRHATEL